MWIKRYLTLLLLMATLSVITGCSRSQIDAPEDRSLNEAVARKLYDPLNQYFEANKTYPESLSLLIPSYISELPKTVAGHEFQYRAFESSKTKEKKTGFSLSWDQKNIQSGEVIACNVRSIDRDSDDYKGDMTKDMTECWNPNASEH
jgi:hypothetical protein